MVVPSVIGCVGQKAVEAWPSANNRLVDEPPKRFIDFRAQGADALLSRVFPLIETTGAPVIDCQAFAH